MSYLLIKRLSPFGQYFTGRHIIKPLVKLLLEDETSDSITGGIENNTAKNPKKICDPACGTGGFLTEVFKHINSLFSESVDVNDFSSKSIYGYDIFPENITKTKINLYLAGDGFSEMESINTLTTNITKKFDYIVTNPPYGDGQTIIDVNVINNSRLDINFLIKIVNMLASGGKALVVIPDGILEAPSLADLREWLIKQCKVDKIVELPVFAFAPYTKEKTYALFLTKRGKPLVSSEDAEKNHEKVWFYIVDNDGYVNSDKRFPTKKKDVNGKWLHNELTDWTDSNGTDQDCLLIERWKKREQFVGEKFCDEFGVSIEGKKYGFVSIAEIRKQQSVSYNAMAVSKVLKLVADDFKNSDKKAIKKQEYLFNGESLKVDVAKVLNHHNIEWDSENKCFISKQGNRTTRLLNLLPEKYFRETKSYVIDFKDLKKSVDNTEKELQELFVKTYQNGNKNNDDNEKPIKSLKNMLATIQSLSSMAIISGNECGFPVSDIFKHKQGHQITDEELYNSNGKVRVISGADAKLKGYSESTYIEQQDLPCFSYQTKGNNSLIIHIKSTLFDANNTAVMIPKDSWRKNLVLEYIMPKLARNMAELKTSNDGVSYIDTRVLETSIGLPLIKDTNQIDIEAQKEVVTYQKKIQLLEAKLVFMIKDLTMSLITQ